jgi:hypothetical protein
MDTVRDVLELGLIIRKMCHARNAIKGNTVAKIIAVAHTVIESSFICVL